MREDGRSATGIPQTTGAHEREHNMSKKGQNMPKRHKNPGPGTQVDLKNKKPLLGQWA